MRCCHLLINSRSMFNIGGGIFYLENHCGKTDLFQVYNKKLLVRIMAMLFCGWVLVPPLTIPISVPIYESVLLLRYELNTLTWTNVIDLSDPTNVLIMNAIDSISIVLVALVAAAYSVAQLEVLTLANLMARTVR